MLLYEEPVPLFIERSDAMFLFIALASLLGAGFAIDVAIVTISRFRDQSLTFKNWTAPIAGFHILFLTISYFVFWSAVEKYPWLKPVVGISGFLLMSFVVYEVVCKNLDLEPRFSLSALLEKWLPIPQQSGNRIVAGIAISLDALLGGPAVSIVAHDAEWALTQVLWSFLIVGLTVGGIAEWALWFAKRLRQKEFKSVRVFCFWLIVGAFLEIAVLGGFALMALLKGVVGEGSPMASVLLSATGVALYGTTVWSKLLAANYRRAKESIEARTPPAAA